MVIDSFLRKPIILQRPPVRVAYEFVGRNARYHCVRKPPPRHTQMVVELKRP